MMWNLQLSNNSFEWKNVTFLGVKTYSDPCYIFPTYKTPQPPPRYTPPVAKSIIESVVIAS